MRGLPVETWPSRPRRLARAPLDRRAVGTGFASQTPEITANSNSPRSAAIRWFIVVDHDDSGGVTVDPLHWGAAGSGRRPRFGGWLSAVWWLEKLDHAATNYATGRTDPPPCRKDAPSWASVTSHELSSLHVCPQKNTSKEGVERAEVFLKSNRRTAQFVTVPAWRDYLWVESQPPAVRELLTAEVGGNRNDVLLLGGGEMSRGSRQPFLDESSDVPAYQNGFIGMVNQVGAMTGGVTGGDLLGVAISALECVREAALDDTTIKCILTLLENPDLAVAGFDDLLRGVNLGVVERDQFLGVVRKGLDRFAPSAKALVKALAFTEAVSNTWDAIWDNLADGRLTLSLKGTRQPGSPPPSMPPPPSPAGTRPPTTRPPACHRTVGDGADRLLPGSCRRTLAGHAAIECWGPPRLLTAEVSVDSGRVAGEVDVSGSFVPGGAIDGAVRCGRIPLRSGRPPRRVRRDDLIWRQALVWHLHRMAGPCLATGGTGRVHSRLRGVGGRGWIVHSVRDHRRHGRRREPYLDRTCRVDPAHVGRHL